MELKEINHILSRTGWGMDLKKIKSFSKLNRTQAIDQIFKDSEKIYPISIDLKAFNSFSKKLNPIQKKQRKELAKKGLFELNFEWMKKLSCTDATLREKMTFFFHDHFAVNVKSPQYNLDLNNLMRKHCLGDFKTLLMEVSKSPAMILFLNNKQNKKGQPNENFAREVMELFTLGRDNGYSEKDIQEAARAFTGWTIKDEQFFFNQRQHDFGSKTFLGKTGNFKGEDIIRILLENKQTARYLTEKLVDFFIGRKIDEQILEQFTDKFYNSDYNLSVLVRNILESDEFWNEKSIGTKIKSPIEYLAGIMRLSKIEFNNPKTLLLLQKRLNQVLFKPPNVAGWTSGKGWIDSSTLMTRMKIPSLLLNNGVIEWDEKDSMPESRIIATNQRREATKKRVQKRMKTKVDWNHLEKQLSPWKNQLIELLIVAKPSQSALQTLAVSDSTSIKDLTVEIMSLPEYQLC